MSELYKLIGGTIIGVDNGEKGYQSNIVIRSKEGEMIIITATPERKFKIGKQVD